MSALLAVSAAFLAAGIGSSLWRAVTQAHEAANLPPLPPDWRATR